MDFGLLIAALGLPSLTIPDKATLEKQVEAFRKKARENLAPDDEFVVSTIDWNNLVATREGDAWADMYQGLRVLGSYDCMLNAARFVFQRKFDVQLGTISPGRGFNYAGDWIFWCLHKGRYSQKFDSDWEQAHELSKVDMNSNIPTKRDVSVTATLLNSTGIGTGQVMITSNDPADQGNIVQTIARAALSPTSGKFLILAGDNEGAGHAYVVYDTKTVTQPNKPAELYVLAYDPWTGKNAYFVSDPADPNQAGNWLPVKVFIDKFGLPLTQGGKVMTSEEKRTSSVHYFQYVIASS